MIVNMAEYFRLLTASFLKQKSIIIIIIIIIIINTLII
jgi:hypothetical protein